MSFTTILLALQHHPFAPTLRVWAQACFLLGEARRGTSIENHRKNKLRKRRATELTHFGFECKKERSKRACGVRDELGTGIFAERAKHSELSEGESVESAVSRSTGATSAGCARNWRVFLFVR